MVVAGLKAISVYRASVLAWVAGTSPGCMGRYSRMAFFPKNNKTFKI
jgi:hypothetical protein